MDCFIGSKSDGANIIRKAAGDLPELPEKKERSTRALKSAFSEPHLENSCRKHLQSAVLGRRMDQLPLEGGSFEL